MLWILISFILTEDVLCEPRKIGFEAYEGGNVFQKIADSFYTTSRRLIKKVPVVDYEVFVDLKSILKSFLVVKNEEGKEMLIFEEGAPAPEIDLIPLIVGISVGFVVIVLCFLSLCCCDCWCFWWLCNQCCQCCCCRTQKPCCTKCCLCCGCWNDLYGPAGCCRWCTKITFWLCQIGMLFIAAGLIAGGFMAIKCLDDLGDGLHSTTRVIRNVSDIITDTLGDVKQHVWEERLKEGVKNAKDTIDRMLNQVGQISIDLGDSVPLPDDATCDANDRYEQTLRNEECSDKSIPITKYCCKGTERCYDTAGGANKSCEAKGFDECCIVTRCRSRSGLIGRLKDFSDCVSDDAISSLRDRFAPDDSGVFWKALNGMSGVALSKKATSCIHGGAAYSCYEETTYNDANPNPNTEREAFEAMMDLKYVTDIQKALGETIEESCSKEVGNKNDHGTPLYQESLSGAMNAMVNDMREIFCIVDYLAKEVIDFNNGVLMSGFGMDFDKMKQQIAEGLERLGVYDLDFGYNTSCTELPLNMPPVEHNENDPVQVQIVALLNETMGDMTGDVQANDTNSLDDLIQAYLYRVNCAGWDVELNTDNPASGKYKWISISNPLNLVHSQKRKDGCYNVLPPQIREEMVTSITQVARAGLDSSTQKNDYENNVPMSGPGHSPCGLAYDYNGPNTCIPGVKKFKEILSGTTSYATINSDPSCCWLEWETMRDGHLKEQDAIQEETVNQIRFQFTDMERNEINRNGFLNDSLTSINDALPGRDSIDSIFESAVQVLYDLKDQISGIDLNDTKSSITDMLDSIEEMFGEIDTNGMIADLKDTLKTLATDLDSLYEDVGEPVVAVVELPFILIGGLAIVLVVALLLECFAAYMATGQLCLCCGQFCTFCFYCGLGLLLFIFSLLAVMMMEMAMFLYRDSYNFIKETPLYAFIQNMKEEMLDPMLDDLQISATSSRSGRQFTLSSTIAASASSSIAGAFRQTGRRVQALVVNVADSVAGPLSLMSHIGSRTRLAGDELKSRRLRLGLPAPPSAPVPESSSADEMALDTSFSISPSSSLFTLFSPAKMHTLIEPVATHLKASPLKSLSSFSSFVYNHMFKSGFTYSSLLSSASAHHRLPPLVTSDTTLSSAFYPSSHFANASASTSTPTLFPLDMAESDEPAEQFLTFTDFLSHRYPTASIGSLSLSSSSSQSPSSSASLSSSSSSLSLSSSYSHKVMSDRIRRSMNAFLESFSQPARDALELLTSGGDDDDDDNSTLAEVDCSKWDGKPVNIVNPINHGNPRSTAMRGSRSGSSRTSYVKRESLRALRRSLSSAPMPSPLRQQQSYLHLLAADSSEGSGYDAQCNETSPPGCSSTSAGGYCFLDESSEGSATCSQDICLAAVSNRAPNCALILNDSNPNNYAEIDKLKKQCECGCDMDESMDIKPFPFMEDGFISCKLKEALEILKEDFAKEGFVDDVISFFLKGRRGLRFPLEQTLRDILYKFFDLMYEVLFEDTGETSETKETIYKMPMLECLAPAKSQFSNFFVELMRDGFGPVVNNALVKVFELLKFENSVGIIFQFLDSLLLNFGRALTMMYVFLSLYIFFGCCHICCLGCGRTVWSESYDGEILKFLIDEEKDGGYDFGGKENEIMRSVMEAGASREVGGKESSDTNAVTGYPVMGGYPPPGGYGPGGTYEMQSMGADGFGPEVSGDDVDKE